MSQRRQKQYRRIARGIAKVEIGEGMEALRHITRKRPRWIPKRVWILAYLPLFKRVYWGLVYKHME